MNSVFVLVSELLPYVNIVLVVTIIFMERKNVVATWAWIMVLALLPGLGFILYLIFGYSPKRAKVFQLKNKEDKEMQKYITQIKEMFNKTETFNDPSMIKYKDMMLLHLNSSHSVFTENNELEIFTDGNDKFNSLLKDIKDAKEHIHIAYYIIRNDEIGNKVIDALTQKAKEGVEVRFLYDEVGSRSLRKKTLKRLIDAGGKVKPFFPSLMPLINFKLNYRNHRKIVVIDGKIGYVGGFNIGDEYLGKNKKFGYWRDTHLKIKGDAVNLLQIRFLLDWRYASGEDIYFNKKYLFKNDKLGKIGLQIVSSGPDSEWQQIKYGYIKMIDSAQEKIYIQTPYLVLDESISEALKIAVLSGVDVKIMIPNKPDHLFIYWATLSNVGELLKVGVKAYIYNKGFLHSKMMIVDDKVSSIGTANLDIRSFKLNFEVNAFIYDSKVSKHLSNVFKDDIKNSEEITIEKYNDRPKTIKFKESISRLLSPIL